MKNPLCEREHPERSDNATYKYAYPHLRMNRTGCMAYAWVGKPR